MYKLLLLIFFLASLLFFRFVTFSNSHPPYTDGQEVGLDVTLQEEPDFSNKGQKFTIKTSTNQIISVTAEAFPRLHYGEVVTISGKLQEKELENDKKIFILSYPDINVRKEASDPISHAANSVRERSGVLFQRTLPPTSASLLMGIVFGAKERFASDFKESLSSTGVLHVIAASGMNVTFVAGALLYTLGYFFKRQVALLIGIAGIIFYVFLVGFQPSIIRAATMAIFAFGAGMLGRQNLALFSIVLTGYCMLLWQPSWLFDVGFQLSFLATVGILVGGRLVPPSSVRTTASQRKLGVLGMLGRVFGESVATTFAAQVGTLPILLGTFGTFGLLSIVVNGLVLWIVPIVMILGSLAVLLGFIFEPVAQLFLFVSLPFLLFFEAVVSFFGGMGWTVTIEELPWQMGVGYYLILVAIIVLMRQLKSQKAKVKNTIQN